MGVPLGSRISYQRTAAWLLPTLTVWLVTSDSWSPKLRYSSRYISRSASGSSPWFVPGWVMQSVVVPGVGGTAGQLNDWLNGAVVSPIGPVKLDAAGSVQSTWNRYRAIPLVPVSPANTSGEPAGGCTVPPRSAGSKILL